MKNKLNSSITVKSTNTSLVLTTLKDRGPMTKSTLSKHTGLSIASCGYIINDLIKANRVIEGETVLHGRGRPAKKYMYNPDYSHALCLTITGDTTSDRVEGVVVDLHGKILFREEYYYHGLTFEVIDRLISDLLDAHTNIDQIGIGIPGFTSDGQVINCDVSSLDGCDIRQQLENKYKLPVFVENEMHLSAYGYYKYHPEYRGDSIAVFHMPDDFVPGAGFVINGQVIKGETGFAGEISHLPFGFPYSEKELIRRCKDPETAMSIILKAVISIITIINPAVIIFAGNIFTEQFLSVLQEKCKKIIPDIFAATFRVEEDFHVEYLRGVILFTLDSMSSRVRLAESSMFI